MKNSFVAALLLIIACNAYAQAQWNPGTPSSTIYYNGGNVGIGMSDPKYPLSVKGIINSEANGDYYGAWFGGESRTDKPSINVGAWWNNKGSIYWNSNKMFFKTQIGSEIFENSLVLDQGRVGVGILSPQYRLDVVDNMRVQGDTPYLVFGRWNDNFNASLYSYTTSYANDNVAFAINNTFNNSFPTSTFSSARIRLYTANANPHASISFETRPPNGSYLTRMVITSEGNVGIGTTSPQYKLHVSGSGHFQNRLTVQGEIPNDNNAAFWNNSDTGYGFYSQGGAGGRYAFHFLNKEGASIIYGRGDGNVGIGTTSPDAKLAVKGVIHTQEVKVDLLGAVAPDYVFEPTYELQPLGEVEDYIKQHKHLPEVPSAKEMEEQGVNLKEMNMLLLKKVEELTLHLIEQQKLNIAQQEKIDSQQQGIIRLISEVEELKNKNNK